MRLLPSAKILTFGFPELLRGRPRIQVLKLPFPPFRPALLFFPFSLYLILLLRMAATMDTTAFNLDFLLSTNRDTRDGWNSNWLPPLSPSSSGLYGLCGLFPHESTYFAPYFQGLFDGLTGYDASYNSLADWISTPTTAFNGFPFDPLDSSWDTYGLSWDDLISPQNHTNTATGFQTIDNTELESLELASGAGLCDGTLLQYVNDSNIQAPSSASFDSESDCADDTDAIILTGEGSVPAKPLGPSRPVSDAASQTYISAARIKSTRGFNNNDKFTRVPILVPPVCAEDVPVDNSSEDLHAKRRKVSPRSPGKRRKITPPYAKSRKPSPDEHNFRIDKITRYSRKYQWSRRKGVWESDDDLLKRSDVSFDEVTEVEVFPDGLSSQQVVLSRENTGLFCGTDPVWERHYSLKGDTIMRLVMDPDEIQKAPKRIA